MWTGDPPAVKINPNDDRPSRIAIAMSGGVDSTIAARLMLDQGHEAFGITMKLAGIDESRQEEILSAAASAARSLGIEHHIIDLGREFGNEIIDNFVATYSCGKTPSPCVLCNRFIKFGALAEAAKNLGASAMATGHYARISYPQGAAPELLRAKDELKDQSYFLFAVPCSRLEFLRFPLGDMTKDEVRGLALRMALPSASKPDSQDICFIPGGDYASFVRSRNDKAAQPGDIVHLDGRILGRHEGIIHYTVGQRKGLGIGGGHTENNAPLFVVKIDAARNRVIVGERETLASCELTVEECNWLTAIPGEREVSVKFRSVMKPVPAILKPCAASATAKIFFPEPQYGISPGQAAVCYEGDRILGGGWIT